MRIEPGDARGLARALVAIDSRNPTLVAGAPGEWACAHALAAVLTAWGFAVELSDAAPGRPNVVARLGSGAGRSLLLTGHLDTVGVEGMTHAPFGAEERDGALWGRGAADMKAGVAAMCAAAWRAHQAAPLVGEVRLAAVADEEATSLGTRALVAAGLRADAAVVTEPTALSVAVAHKGFAWITVTVLGTAAHGSRPDVGVDAIRHAGLVLAALHRADAALVTRTHPLLGRASLHAATISGGEGLSTYPARCTFTVERRTLPGEHGAHALAEVQSAIARAAEREPALRATAVLDFEQAPLDTDPATPIVGALRAAAPGAPVTGVSYWADAALWHAAGVPTVLFGPGDIARAHGATEWVSLAEVDAATDVLTRLIAAWCC